MKFTILTHQLIKGEIASVHRIGCRDIERDQRDHGSTAEDIDADSAADAVEIYLDDELREMGYGNADIKVHNCCKQSGLRR